VMKSYSSPSRSERCGAAEKRDSQLHLSSLLGFIGGRNIPRRRSAEKLEM
jgi:hypothetical protein